MLGLTGLIDALMAARLTPRLDLLGLKPETTVGAPGAAVAVPRTANDVRLPSRAALDRLVPSGASGGDAAAPSASGAPPSIDTRLSVAARVIGAVLADLQAEPGPVRGHAPLLLPVARQGTNAAALAGTLAQTVSDSGLFYESHLAEFAAGTRTLAQMAREPQARWASPVMAGQSAVAAATVPMPAMAADVATSPAPNPSTQAPAADAPENPTAQPARAVARGETVAAPAPDAARVQAAYALPDAGSEMPTPRTADPARASVDVTNTPAPRGAEVIHPQAVTVVHQQLDLLASAVFRWSGQAWPEVPMAWSIEEEPAKPGAREGEPAEDEEGARRWSTTVSLVLPRLGEVDLRLSLSGPTVQAHLHAHEDATVARLRGDAGRLAQRFEAVGLQLQQLQVTAKAMG
ncbi:flagellar hook-length control protein FliK [Acidovorax cavernicola]|uniref:Flagellar hook-length control protein FliK n=1 Tax=Acidovorax cavernicola TaxID=1675792 RepID=A0A9X8D3L3_9BURK|nr:flagellar hook-length control protein FliK [Acidovorax cavernicola]RIX78196.1 flagellar hook-length control protein FliK [Acidovorax cavernicola]